jgi:uncharacterized protein (TIGR02453 family)
MAGQRYFSNELFKYLTDLAANNDRPWFQSNKDRYDRHIKEASLRFIENFAPHLRTISRHFVADPRPVGGSLFRIYRDTRFSKDKRPYKTHVGIRFMHESAKDVHAPLYYLHIASDEVFVGCGIWHPAGEALRKIREAIVDDPASWKRARNAKKFADVFELKGDSLKTVPRGFDAEHPMIEDLRRKDFIGVKPIAKTALTGPDLMETFTGLCKAGAPLQRFLCRALAVPY